MLTRNSLSTAIAVGLLANAGACAAWGEFTEEDGYEVEWSGYIKNESAWYLKNGSPTGSHQRYIDTANSASAGELFKFENTAKFFFNGDIGEDSSWHGELNMQVDTQGVNDSYRYHELYTSNDYFRELYVDTSAGPVDLRIGKQQVVWGTADGIKLLDIINPADFREFNQDTTEDQRVPIWMIKAETDIGDDGNLQFLVTQHEEHKIAGLNANGDSGAPFIFKGVDTITGQANGFMNIAPVLGRTARFFAQYADAFGGLDSSGAFFASIHRSRVEDFIDGNGAAPDGVWGGLFAGAVCGAHAPTAAVASTRGANAQCLSELANLETSVSGNPVFALAGNNDVTATMDGVWNPDGDNGATTAFEYMPDAAFGTFNTFVNLQTDYRRTYASDWNPNLGLRFRSTTDGGTNWSVNYLYAYDPNPSISIHYENQAGQRLIPIVDRATNPQYSAQGANVVRLVDSNGIQNCIAQTGPTLYEAATGTTGVRTGFGVGGKGCTLVFEESATRIHNLGAWFDTAIDGLSLPLVIRGEFLYQKDTNFPVIDQGALAIGHLTGALKMEKTDFFKYVLGFDTTVMTNLFASLQLIQFINLDYVDDPSPWNADINAMRAYSAANGTVGTQRKLANYRRYSGNFDAMHLTNGLQQTDRVETFASFFLSKPFGPSQEHRWNNIFIWENGGEFANHGYWDRFDFEYAFNDNWIGLFEVNAYFGDRDTLFGQFRDSSSLQLGIKYLFDGS